MAFVLDYDADTHEATLQVKNHFSPHQNLEIFGPHIDPTSVYVGSIYDENGLELSVCKTPMQIVRTHWDGPIEKNAMIRKIRVV